MTHHTEQQNLICFLHNILELLYMFSVQNSVKSINELQDLDITPCTRLCSFDISNKYSNIPKDKVRNITVGILEHIGLLKSQIR